jgi:HK97 family phage prohead protease
MIEHKSYDVTCKWLDDEGGSVDLYAATFHDIDRSNERIEPGAFRNLEKFVNEGWLAVSHDWDRLPIATIDRATQDDKGLRIQASFHSHGEAQSVRAVIKERLSRGKSVKASIGYRVLDDEKIDIEGKSIRSLKSIDLYEASIVQMPCNPAAEIVGAKSHRALHADEVITALREFAAEIKAGRVVSAANLTKIRGWAEKARAVANLADEITAFSDSHDPSAAMPQPAGDQADFAKSAKLKMSIYSDFLATSAKYSSA